MEPRLVLHADSLVISEFLASNSANLADVDGAYSDWIEIHNPTGSAVSLDGWYLTDDARDLTKWRFPAVSIDAGAYLVVFASSKDRTNPAAQLHTNFQLGSDGEYLGLVMPDGETIAYEYAPQYPAQPASDKSYGIDQGITTLVAEGAELRYRVPTSADSAADWTASSYDDTAWNRTSQAVTSVLITEAGTGSPDYVEIQNVSDQAIDTSGWYLVVNRGLGAGFGVNAFIYSNTVFPASLAPGEVVYWTDSTAEHYFGQDIPYGTSGKGWAMVMDAQGEVVDYVPWVYTAADVASMNITVDGHNVRGSRYWSGLGVPASVNSITDTSVYREGNLDRDNASDFVFRTPAVGDPPALNRGLQNPGLASTITASRLPGIGYSLTLPGFNGTMNDDVGPSMYGVNASLWVRTTFDVADPSAFDSLALQMKYNDGFVAYLNGEKIAESGAPASPTWNSAATSTRSITDTLAYRTFNVSDHLGALLPGTNLLAIQAMNVSATDNNFLVLPQLLGVATGTEQRFFATPTPGAINWDSFLGFADGPGLSAPSGFYSAPFQLEFTYPVPATFRYTTDGTEPTETHGTLYSGPVTISTTTVIRAIAFSSQVEPLNVTTRTYLFLDDVIHQPSAPAGWPTLWPDVSGGNVTANYQMDPDVVNNALYSGTIKDDLRAIPTLSLVLPLSSLFDKDTGIYSNPTLQGATWEKAVTAELIDGDGTSLFQVGAGIKIVGGASRGVTNKKHSFRLLFQGEYGPTKLRYDWFGDGATDSFDTITLRAGFNDTTANSGNGTTYLQDRWTAATQNEMGGYGPHGTFVHLYINGLYWGLYNPVERPDDSFAASYLGGNKEDYDVYNIEGTIEGDTAAWNQLMTLTSNPVTNYAAIEQQLDIPNFIDYLIVNQYGGNWDWPQNNWWATRSRLPGGKWRFHSWDGEGCLSRTDDTSNRVTQYGSNLGVIYQRLTQVPAFKQLYADKIHHHLFNDGLLTSQANISRINRLAAEIDRAVVGESARWGDGYSDSRSPSWTRADWLSRINSLRTAYFPSRTAIVLGQYVAAGLYPATKAPSFNQHGGTIPQVGFNLVITNPNTPKVGTVYYTLDGSDPRGADGNPSPTALVSSGSPIPLNQSALVKSRILNGAEWSALNEARFYAFEAAAAGNLAISELNYNPYDPTPEELAIDPAFVNDSFEFVELRNLTADETLDLAGVRFTAGIAFDFTGSAVETLGPGESVVIVRDAAAFEARYGAGILVAGEYEYENPLSNSGEPITLIDRFGAPIVDFGYDDAGSWPGRADGTGSSLELLDPAGDYGDGRSWRASSEYGGSPGFVGRGPLDEVLVNEVVSHSDPPRVDAIELYNNTDGDIDISGWYLSDSSVNLQKFRIPEDTPLLGKGQYTYFDEYDFNPSGGLDPLTFPNDFALNGATGDDVWLVQTNSAGKLTYFADHVEFPAAAAEESFGRWPDAEGGLYPMTQITMGYANSGPRVGPVILSEINYHPGTMLDEDDLEFVEIYNPGSDAVDLTNWRIRGGIDFDFAAGAAMDPHATIVVLSFDPGDVANADRLAAFLAAYPTAASASLVGPFTGQLDNGGDTVRLQRPDAPPPLFISHLLEDEVAYDDASPWPTEADGAGASLHRRETNLWGDAVASWEALPPSPGTVEFATVAAQVAGRWVFYNNSAFDGRDPLAGVSDDAAIAVDKQALLPGQTASFVNYTSYGGGINGIMVDIESLANAAALDKAIDFQFKVGNNNDPAGWANAPLPSSLTVRPGMGENGSYRVTLIWAGGAIENQWLQVAVLATPNTGLSQPDVFYFGNAVGEAGNRPGNAIVNATDEILARNFPCGLLGQAAIDNPYDYDRDRQVNGTDQIIARNHQTNPLNMLRLIAAPAGDLLMARAGADVSQSPPDSPIDLAWLYEFNLANAKSPSSKKASAVETAVDKLLATDWI